MQANTCAVHNQRYCKGQLPYPSLFLRVNVPSLSAFKYANDELHEPSPQQTCTKSVLSKLNVEQDSYPKETGGMTTPHPFQHSHLPPPIHPDKIQPKTHHKCVQLLYPQSLMCGTKTHLHSKTSQTLLAPSEENFALQLLHNVVLVVQLGHFHRALAILVLGRALSSPVHATTF